MDEDEKYPFLDDPADTPAPEVVQDVVQETAVVPETPAPEVPATPEQEMVPLAALKAEREKRQRYEAQLQQAQTQQFDPAVFYQDPRHIQSYVDQQLAAARVGMSRDLALSQFPDYEELEALFVEEAEKNPALRAELVASGSPALFAYNTAKAIKTMREAQSGELEKRLRAEIEAKVRAELRPVPQVPPDLSTSRSAHTQAPVEEMTLDSILSERKR